MTWRTAHLVVSGMAFAVWSATSVLYFVMCENTITAEWWLYGPAAAFPAFWCVYAWFAARRTDSKTSERLTVLAVPVLLCGLGMLLVAITDVMAQPVAGHTRPFGMGVMMVGECCWLPALLCGLISLVWAVVLQVNRHRLPREDS